MKQRLLAFVLAALLLPAAHADQPAAQAPAAKAGTERPLLWKVSDADNAVYLLGSFHLLKPDDYPLPAEVDRAFDDANRIVGIRCQRSAEQRSGKKDASGSAES